MAQPRFASVTFVLGDRVVATISDDPRVQAVGAVFAALQAQAEQCRKSQGFVATVATNGKRPRRQR